MTNEAGLLTVIGELRSSLELERERIIALEKINNDLAVQLASAQNDVSRLTSALTHSDNVVANLRERFNPCQPTGLSQ